MSSKITRPGDGVEVSAIQWRPAGGANPAANRTGAADSGMSVVSESRLAEMQRDTEARVKSAYAQGLAAGETGARQQAQQQVDAALKGLHSMIAELGALRKHVRAEAEEDAMKLAIAIARRVLYRELATDPEAILGLIKAAFGRLNARETHRLRLSPADAVVVEEHRGKLQLPPAIEILADGSLTSGGAIFETLRGDLDASIDTQLSEIDRGLTDLMKRRK